MLDRSTLDCRSYLPVWLTLAYIFLSCLASPAIADTRENDDDIISIGITVENKPYSFIEGRTVSGFSIDLLREISANNGLKFTYRIGPWPEVYSALQQGHLDAIDGISYREDKANDLLFTDPYYVRQTVVMQDSDNPVGAIDSLEDLKNLRVGIVEDIYYRSLLVDNGISTTSYGSLADLVRALAFGWVDVIIGPSLTLEFTANEAGFRFLKVIGPAPLGPLTDEDLRIAVPKTNPGLFERINDGLNAIPQQRKAELLRRWQEFGGVSLSEAPDFRLNPEARRFLRELGPIRVGLMKDYAPFSFKDGGKLQGLTVDVLNRVSDLTGIQVIPVAGQWSELYSMLKGGEIDVLANMSENQERLAFTRFTEPYYNIPNVVFSRDDSLEFKGLASLRGRTVALGADIYYEEQVVQALGNDARVYSTQEAMFQALEHGDVDVVLASLPNGNFWVREQAIPDVRIVGELNFDGHSGEDLRFGVALSRAPLAGIFNRALEAISPTERRIIEDRWLGASASLEPHQQNELAFSPIEKGWLEKHGSQITYCIDNDWKPLEGLDDSGRHTGLSAEVLRLFSERSDIRFIRVPTESWPEALEAARTRKCDLLSLAMKTPERSQFMSFTEPYVEVPNIVLGRIESPFIESVSELRGKPVGVVAGYAFLELLRNRYPGLELREVSDENEGLRLLQGGELSGYVTTLATASYHIQNLGLADLKVIGRIPADWSLSVAVRNDDPILLGILEKLVASLGPAERNRLEGYWRDIRIEQSVDYSILWQILAGVGFLAALLIYWNRKLGRLNRELEQANATLARLSVTDDLTQLGNRSYFDLEFRKGFQWCQRHSTGYAVAMVDADLFKQINDTYGHEAGDACLIRLADTMRAHFRRETDRLSRFGGEEFVICTSYQDREDTIKRLNDFRKTIEDTPVFFNGHEIHVTVSIGLATGIPEPDDTAAEFLRLADQALYAAKENGRNRLEVRAVRE
ncbi:transporter substrate-binding domain-containing protein [Marinobacter salinexigens]|uniref:Transporter substrate-binding domain-containing protein n=1 Tax=Marinobacter salinexigens TaxID=2919747 RepID=A0A5B0VBN4_9GAMM|nr:transporter substrate-binding domain-containing protein [Marinobacter salinexigens]KAA1171471.1 transporter substrate-binding domain-containing protein [Marinobacter salinexigens]